MPVGRNIAASSDRHAPLEARACARARGHWQQLSLWEILGSMQPPSSASTSTLLGLAAMQRSAVCSPGRAELSARLQSNTGSA